MKPEVAEHLERADELLVVAAENLENKHPADSISRSYYAMFHAATAVLKELGVERSSHHATWAAFGEHVAAKHLMDPAYHRMGLDTLSARGDSDYLSRPRDTVDDAATALASARSLVAACRALIESRCREHPAT